MRHLFIIMLLCHRIFMKMLKLFQSAFREINIQIIQYYTNVNCIAFYRKKISFGINLNV
jgi:hypothetical protein